MIVHTKAWIYYIHDYQIVRRGVPGYLKLEHKELFGPKYLIKGSVRYSVNIFNYTNHIHSF